jgi:hypothetical protein
VGYASTLADAYYSIVTIACHSEKKGAVRGYQIIAFEQNALLIVRVDFAPDPAVGKHHFVGGIGLQINYARTTAPPQNKNPFGPNSSLWESSNRSAGASKKSFYDSCTTNVYGNLNVILLK